MYRSFSYLCLQPAVMNSGPESKINYFFKYFYPKHSLENIFLARNNQTSRTVSVCFYSQGCFNFQKKERISISNFISGCLRLCASILSLRSSRGLINAQIQLGRPCKQSGKVLVILMHLVSGPKCGKLTSRSYESFFSISGLPSCPLYLPNWISSCLSWHKKLKLKFALVNPMVFVQIGPEGNEIDLTVFL